MSLLINNELIWVSIPKCASMSIEYAFIDSDLPFEHYEYPNLKELLTKEKHLNANKQVTNTEYHGHYRLSQLKYAFGNKESFCIRRDWFERWLSSLQQFWKFAEAKNLEPIIKYEEIDNDFIYKTFNKEFANTLTEINGFKKCTAKLVDPKRDATTAHLFASQNYWTNNTKCDYEFDINNLVGAERLIKEKFNYEIKFLPTNTSDKLKNNLIYDDKLRNHIWDLFEKPFYKNKKTLI